MATNIEWTARKNEDGSITKGETWNPTVGCSEKSAGCRDCYAATMAYRLAAMGQKNYEGIAKKLPNGKKVWTGKINMIEDKLLFPATLKKPTNIFPGSMSDIFHEDIPFSFIDKIFAIMMLCPQHTFQVLTKRTDRMLEYCKSRQDFEEIDEAAQIIVGENPHLFFVVEKMSKEARSYGAPDIHITNELLPHLKDQLWYSGSSYGEFGKDWEFMYEGDFPAKHIWLGTSIEDQKAADERGKPLYELHRMGWITWVSNEPYIGPIDWEKPNYFGFLDWLVCGGESGPTARPMNPDWARASRDFCEKNKIPFFFKQWGNWGPWKRGSVFTDTKPLVCIKPSGELSWWAGDATIGQTDNYSTNFEETDTAIQKGDKHDNGRLLDGKLHDAYPIIIRNSQIANQ